MKPDWKEYADTYCQVAKAMIDRGHLPPSPPFIQALLGIPANKKKTLTPPRLERLAWLLPLLPPLISRTDAKHWVGGVSSNTLANADQENLGPRIRYVIGGRRVVYPTAYLLEWLENRGIEVKLNGDRP
jgi:hypothetical protein